MLIMMKKFKYLLLFIFLTISSNEVFSKKNDHLVIHGSYTFETFEGQEKYSRVHEFF